MIGVVLAAAYMLRMLQRLAYGGTKNPDHSKQPDLSFREIVTLVPLLVFVFWIGLHPAPFTGVMHTTVQNLIQQAAPAAQTPSLAVAP
jgi:NADH-quinone oxidoreductase subunit M